MFLSPVRLKSGSMARHAAHTLLSSRPLASQLSTTKRYLQSKSKDQEQADLTPTPKNPAVRPNTQFSPPSASELKVDAENNSPALTSRLNNNNEPPESNRKLSDLADSSVSESQHVTHRDQDMQLEKAVEQVLPGLLRDANKSAQNITAQEKLRNPRPRRDPSTQTSAPKFSPIIRRYNKDGRLDKVPYWQKVPRWSSVSEQDFLTYSWQVKNLVQRQEGLVKFLQETLPSELNPPTGFEHIRTKEDFIKDVQDGIAVAPMAVRLTAHSLSMVDWSKPFTDPIVRQFIPRKSTHRPDHSKTEYDSLHEHDDEKVNGLVHRYPGKALFLAVSYCPLYCRYCTRSWSVGPDTGCLTKESMSASYAAWDRVFDYIANTPALNDIVVSGGDSYMLLPEQLKHIGERLLAIDHIRRIRFASKGFAVSPARVLDAGDAWAEELIGISDRARKYGKKVALHTHINHPNEISWVTREAAQKLYENGVRVRNQCVLLKGVNDTVETMSNLIHELADNNIDPYYVYMCDMVRGVEDLRTSLQTMLDIQHQVRGTIAGFEVPQFVVDLPGGGGKRLANDYESYDRKTGRSVFTSPVLSKTKGDRTYEYWDPVHSLN